MVFYPTSTSITIVILSMIFGSFISTLLPVPSFWKHTSISQIFTRALRSSMFSARPHVSISCTLVSMLSFILLLRHLILDHLSITLSGWWSGLLGILVRRSNNYQIHIKIFFCMVFGTLRSIHSRLWYLIWSLPSYLFLIDHRYILINMSCCMHVITLLVSSL